MMMVLQPVFVTHNLTVQLIHQLIHRRVQILVGTLCEHVAPFHVDIALGTLPSFLFLLLLYGEQHLDIDHLVKMSHDSIKLGRDITAQGRGNFKMVTADRQIHKKPPIALGLKILPSRMGKNRNQKPARLFDRREFTMRPNTRNCNAFFPAALQQM
jgi:hypothetical protein